MPNTYGDERMIRHDLGHLCADEKWGDLGMAVDYLLDTKDTEITRLRVALQDIAEMTDENRDSLDDAVAAARGALAEKP